MQSNIFWRIAWRGLKLNARRHLLTGSALAIGFASTVLLGGWMMNLEHYLVAKVVYLDQMGHVVLFKKEGRIKHVSHPGQFSFSPEEQAGIEKAIQATDGGRIEKVGKSLRGAGLASNGCFAFPFITNAVEPAMEAWTRQHPMVTQNVPELVNPKKGVGYWKEGAAKSATPITLSPRMSVILGKPATISDTGKPASAEMIDCKSPGSGRAIASDAGVQLMVKGFHGGISAIDAEVVGHSSTGLSFEDETYLGMPLADAKSLFNTDNVTHYHIYLKDPSEHAKIQKELQEKIEGAGVKAEVRHYKEREIGEFYVGTMSFIYVMIINFIVLVCGIAVLSIVNALSISLVERKAEIATLRAIGFRNRAISSLFLRENVMLGLVSFAVGGAISWGFAKWVNSADIRYTLPSFEGKPQLLLKPELGLSFTILTLLFALVCIATVLTCSHFMKSQIADTSGGH